REPAVLAALKHKHRDRRMERRLDQPETVLKGGGHPARSIAHRAGVPQGLRLWAGYFGYLRPSYLEVQPLSSGSQIGTGAPPLKISFMSWCLGTAAWTAATNKTLSERTLTTFFIAFSCVEKPRVCRAG